MGTTPLHKHVRVNVLPGGVPGPLKGGSNTMLVNATLLSVRHVSADLLTNADLTAAFTVVQDPNKRDGIAMLVNGGGVDTTGNFIVCTYHQPD